MNEKLQYAQMLEIPDTTCNISLKPIKKKKVKRKKDLAPETVKQELLDKVNAETESTAETPAVEETETSQLSNLPEVSQTATVRPKAKEKFKFSTVTIQLAVVIALIAVIAVTNLVNANSGINVFIKSLFSSTGTVAVDERDFNDFTPVLSFGESQITLNEGMATISGEGSVYAPCDGKVTEATLNENGLYSLTISHSQNFSTKIEGLKFCYSNVGDSVYANIPVGYLENENATMCFLGAEGALITGYEIIDNAVIWAV